MSGCVVCSVIINTLDRHLKKHICIVSMHKAQKMHIYTLKRAKLDVFIVFLEWDPIVIFDSDIS